MIYNNKEFPETDIRRYVNMESPTFNGLSEAEVYDLLSKDALIMVMLQMIKECTINIAMYSGCPCHGKLQVSGGTTIGNQGKDVKVTE